jgi:hypothetical protein
MIALPNLLVRIVQKIAVLLVKISSVMLLMELASLVRLAGLNYTVAKLASPQFTGKTVLRTAAPPARTRPVIALMEAVNHV